MVSRRSHVHGHIRWIALIDLISLTLSAMVGVTLRLGWDEIDQYVFDHIDGWLLLFGSVLLANYLAGSYRLQNTFSRFNLAVTWLFSVVFAVFVLSLTAYAWFTFLLGRGVLILALISYSVVSLLLKMLLFQRLFRHEFFQCNTVMVGADERALEMRKILEGEWVLPIHRVVAFIRLVGRREMARKDAIGGVPVVETTLDTFVNTVESLHAALVVVALEDMREMPRIHRQLRRLRFWGVEVLTPLSVVEMYSGRLMVDQIDEEYLMQIGMESGVPIVRQMKRFLDMLLSLTACILFFPLGVLAATLIKLSAPRSPVLYRQARVGRFGRTFEILKFRTMRDDSERETGPVWSPAGDSRVTAVGRVLRRFRIDELPQFVNILRGEMSLVGPRPERPEIAARLAEQIPFFHERENVLPGLTGWAQIRSPYADSIETAVRKLEYDLYYIKHVSLSLDLQVILSTLRIVILGKERTV